MSQLKPANLLRICALAMTLLCTSAYASTVSISKVEDAIIGQHKTVTISVDTIVAKISSFDLTIAYEGKKASVYRINPGNIFDSCGWEYFTYRLISPDTVANYLPAYPISIINVVGQASLSVNPATACPMNSATLAEIEVTISRQPIDNSADRLWFNFFWQDCSDNVLTSLSGDTTFVGNELLVLRSSSGPVPDLEYPFPGFGLPDGSCNGLRSEEVQEVLVFINSGIFWRGWIVDGCTHQSGDINLNNVRFETTDLILFINYFVIGITVFQVNPAGQISETDVNCDGSVLGLQDLYMMFRIAAGDWWFFEKPTIVQPDAQLLVNSSGNRNEVSLAFDDDVSLLYLRMTSNGNLQLSPDDFQFERAGAMVGQIGDTITMLLMDIEDGLVLSSGTNSIFQYSGKSGLNVEGSVVDKYGREVVLKLESGTLPDSPELLQNYPNPFNPSTTIEFNLPTHSEWQIEIYNVTGQLINSFNGASIGKVELEWDGTNLDGVDVASGVYFYKLITADQTTSRKMLLLK